MTAFPLAMLSVSAVLPRETIGLVLLAVLLMILPLSLSSHLNRRGYGWHPPTWIITFCVTYTVTCSGIVFVYQSVIGGLAISLPLGIVTLAVILHERNKIPKRTRS